MNPRRPVAALALVTAVTSLAVAACGGSGGDPDAAAISDGIARVDGGPIDARTSDAPAGIPDATPPDAGPPDAVPTACRPTAVCSNDLGLVGTGDFGIEFTVNTSATVGSALVAQRGICMHSFFWDLRLRTDGHMSVEYDDANANYRSFVSATVINDGVDHAVRACRVSGVDYLYVDGVLDTTGANVVNFSTALAALQTGDSPCTTFDGTAVLVGTISDVCVGTP